MKIYPNRNSNCDGARVTFHKSGLINFSPKSSDILNLSILDRFVVDIEPEYIRFEKDSNGFKIRKNSIESNSYRFNSRVICKRIIELFAKKGATNISFLVGEKTDAGFELILGSKSVFEKEVGDGK